MDADDLKLYKSETVSDTPANGGREDLSAEVQDNVMNNVFPSLSDAERQAGGSRLRKLFAHNANASNEQGSNNRVFIEEPSTAEDFFVIIDSTQRQVQGDLTGTEKQYATGRLAQQASAGATQIVVDFDDAAETDLEEGDLLWLWGTNGQMFNTAAGSPSWSGNQATIALASPLNVDYPADSICAMVLSAGDLAPSFDSWAENSAQGTYNENSYPPELDNRGSVEDDWTITFTSPTEFTCTGLFSGAVGSGSISADFSPINPVTGQPYFTIRSAGWGGTWQAGDTVTFTTHPAAKPFWLKEIWPAGAAGASNNVVKLQIYGE